jgi:predicted MPP superfamily phosphohydrolase
LSAIMARLGVMVTFVSVMLGATAAGHYYVWARLVRDVNWPKPIHQTLTVLVWLLFLSIPATFWLSRELPPAFGQGLLEILYLWLGLAIGLPALLAVTDLLNGVFLAGRALRGLEQLEPERRLFLKRAFATTVGLSAFGCGVAGMLEARRPIRVKNVEVKLAKLPVALNGFVIAQLSDLHIGPTLRDAFISEVVARTNSIRADLIVITGDLVDGSVEQLRSLLAPLANLKAKYGVYFVPGNHEYYSDIEPWLAFLPSLGIRVLRNSHVSIGESDDRFELVGLDDESAAHVDRAAKPDLDLALRGVDPSMETVLLAHQPKSVFGARNRNIGLQLSGHTHGGQVWPFHWFVLLQQPVISGLARFGRTQLYVSAGTGYWGPPLRLGVPAEITRIVLRSEQKEVLV